jgi:hypothetical protein
MESVQFGFTFQMEGNKEFTTLYTKANSDKIAAALANGADSVEIVHVVRRGPRKGEMDIHRVNFKDDTVINRSRVAKHLLAKVYVDTDCQKSSLDDVLDSIKNERAVAKKSYDAAKMAFEDAKAKLDDITKDGDARLLAIISEKLNGVAI